MFGGGCSLGVGPQDRTDHGRSPGGGDAQVAYRIGSVELMGFLAADFSIDVSTQLAATIVAAAFSDFAWASTVYFDWSFGSDVRLLIGPGVGAAGHGDIHGVRGDAGVELRLAGLLGIEALTTDDQFGFRLMTRPWLAFGGGDRGFELGYGAMLELGFLFYAL